MHSDNPLNKRYVCSSWLFIRLLGLTYFFAFISFGSQLEGLIGSQGILPAEVTMTYVRRNFGEPDWIRFPTLCWWWVSDMALHAHWIIGAGLGVLMMCGLLPHLCLALAWVLYLSLVVVGRDFTAFQWDNLLLETGLLAFFLILPTWWCRARKSIAGNTWIIALYAWLLFRIMFSSGLGKFITSNDSSWDNLTALTVHFETQPLPTWLGYYWHQLPRSFHTASCVGVMVAQVFLPFLLFGPIWSRRLAVFSILSFQVLIALTGNYGFFNLNTIILAVLLVDDGAWQWLLARSEKFFPKAMHRRLFSPIRQMLEPSALEDIQSSTTTLTRLGLRQTWNLSLGAFVVFYLVSSSLVMMRTARIEGIAPEAFEKVLGPFSSFRSINGYGLFVVMTTSRNEILVQGSDDGQTWKDYEFKYKPGLVTSRPEFMAPHMPRLDWQMWFAALGKVRNNRWFVAFVHRLLKDEKDVLELLQTNPFPKKPPRYIRALKYDYRFTDLNTKSKQGAWWRRTPNGTYMPQQSLQ